MFIPTNGSVAYDLGTVIEGLQYGAGMVGVAAVDPATTTLRTSTGTYTTVSQYASIFVRKIGTDEWVVGGERTAALSDLTPVQGNYILY